MASCSFCLQQGMSIWGRGFQSGNLFMFPTLDFSPTWLCVMSHGLQSLWKAVAPSCPYAHTHTRTPAQECVCVALETQFFTRAVE